MSKQALALLLLTTVAQVASLTSTSLARGAGKPVFCSTEGSSSALRAFRNDRDDRDDRDDRWMDAYDSQRVNADPQQTPFRFTETRERNAKGPLKSTLPFTPPRENNPVNTRVPVYRDPRSEMRGQQQPSAYDRRQQQQQQQQYERNLQEYERNTRQQYEMPPPQAHRQQQQQQWEGARKAQSPNNNKKSMFSSFFNSQEDAAKRAQSVAYTSAQRPPQKSMFSFMSPGTRDEEERIMSAPFERSSQRQMMSSPQPRGAIQPVKKSIFPFGRDKPVQTMRDPRDQYYDQSSSSSSQYYKPLDPSPNEDFSEVAARAAGVQTDWGSRERFMQRPPARPMTTLRSPRARPSASSPMVSPFARAVNARSDRVAGNYARPKYNFWQKIASWQSSVLGAGVGITAVAPFLALHHMVLYPTYEAMGQWQWDMAAAALMGSTFATIYRYSLREDVYDVKLRNNVFFGFVLIRSLARVHIPMECTSTFPMQCGEPLGFMNWDMIQELSINSLESVVLFGVVGGAMDWLLKRSWIRQFPGY